MSIGTYGALVVGAGVAANLLYSGMFVARVPRRGGLAHSGSPGLRWRCR